MKLEVQTSPWSVPRRLEGRLDHRLRPVLVCPTGTQSVLGPGSAASLPRLPDLRIAGQSLPRFELPGIPPNHASGGKGELHLRIGASSISLQLEGLPEVPSPQDEQSGFGMEVRRFLARQVDLMQIPFERALEGRSHQAELDLGEFFEYWSSCADDLEPRLALIVRIAQKAGPVVRDLVPHPRRILRRERALQRIEKVRQIDPAGIRWLARQQGQSLAERAGPRQRLLAVVRHESVDTLENRVLADFLNRCHAEAADWIQDHQSQSDHERFRVVSSFERYCRVSAGGEPFSLLSRPSGIPTPNYVLLQDERYSQVWAWYLQLARRQQVYDSMWAWSQRALAESVTLAIAWGLELVQAEALDGRCPAPWSRSLLARDEHLAGRLTDDFSHFLGWVRDPAGASVLSLATRHQLPNLVERCPLMAPLVEVLPDLVILEHAARGPFRPRLVAAVWIRLDPRGPDLGDDDRQRIGSALSSASGRVGGEAWLIHATAESVESAEVARYLHSAPGGSIELLLVETSLHVERLRLWVHERLLERLEAMDRGH